MTKTLKLRLKDKHASALNEMAREVNFVWNYINELSATHTQRTGKFMSGYDLQKYTAGATKEGLGLRSGSVDRVCAEFASRRLAARKLRLSWRVSNPKSPRKSLGWVPIKTAEMQFRGGQIIYAKKRFSLWDSYGLSQYKLRSGSFNQDSRGRWYINVCVEPKPEKSTGTASIGIDLGLKDFATMSDGTKVEAQQFYRGAEAKLAIAQRANKKSRVKTIHAQITNRRKDHLHKLSTQLVSNNAAIFVGNVNAAALAKTKMAKSVLDAGWSQFRTMLKYKCDHAGVLFEEVNEAFSTVTCSACGSRSGPSGLKDLRIRQWSCTECGVHHDRDVNAAMIIAARGHARLTGGNLDA